jgi:protocatechuate 3,4-dioxygenase beta subunit
MSDGRSRGLVFFVFIALLAGVGGLGIWALLRPKTPADGEAVAERGGARRPIKGTGTSWREDEGPLDASGVLEGRVVDVNGAPVDGANVVLSRARGRGEETAFSTFWQPRGLATTAGGGNFRIEKLVPGDYAATATHEGAGPGQRPTIEIKARQTTRIEIKLSREGLVLSGRILDVGGGAVGGARLTAHSRLGVGRAPIMFAAVASGEGHYRMILPRGPLGLRVEAEGYAPLTESDLLLVRSMTRDLRLVPGGRMVGRVVERAGRQPVPGAEVSLTSALRTDYRQPRDAKADEAGHFEFSGLEPGNYEVLARKGTLIGAGQIVALAVAQTVTDIEIPVDAGHVVSGRVTDDAGAGLGGVAVNAFRDTPPFGQSARTRSNADGSYALEGMLPGNYRLNASEEGHGFASVRARVLAADLNNVDLQMPRATRVTGQVVSADGKPVQGARVRARVEARQSSGGMMTSSDSAVTGEDGSFELRRVLPGRLSLSAQDDQLGMATLGPEEVKAGEAKVLRLVLSRGGSITGTVKGEDDRPAADVRVMAYLRLESAGFSTEQDVSGPDGRYRIANLPPGRVTVSASRGGRASISFGIEDRPDQKNVQLAEREEKVGIDLVVPAAGLTVKGTATTDDGKPVPGAVLTASLEHGETGRSFRGSGDLRAYSQLDGQFTIEDVGKGKYTLRASHPEHPDAELKGVAGGSAGVRLVFPADTSVAGLVVMPDGKPAPHYAITLLPGGKPGETPDEKRRRQMVSFDARTQRVQDPGGAFQVVRLAAGSHELQIAAPGGESGTETVTLQAGERKTGVRIQLQPSLRVTGRVLEVGTSKPVVAATVTARANGPSQTEAQTAADGSFVIEGAPLADRVRVTVLPDYTRYVTEYKELPIKPGQTSVDAGTIKLLPGNARDRQWRDPSERGDLGANVGVEDGRPVARFVRAEGPAGQQGLKRGDLITSINGISTAELGNGALGFLSSGNPGATVTLVVESPGAAPRTITVTLQPPRTGPPAPPAPRSN